MKNPFKSGREGLRSSFFGRPCATLLVLALAVAASPAFAQSKPIPQLVQNGGKFALLVDGKPLEGYYENGVWKTTRARTTSQGDYSPATVNLPAQGASIRVTLMRY